MNNLAKNAEPSAGDAAPPPQSIWDLPYERFCVARGLNAWRVSIAVAHLVQPAGYVEGDTVEKALHEALIHYGSACNPLFGGDLVVERVGPAAPSGAQ